MNKVSLASPAKINLFLKVIDRRRDGYHNILSRMQAVDLSDRLEIERIAGGIRIYSNTKAVPTGKSNLIYRAAELYLKKAKISGGVKIKLTKNIPVAAGLGGGSSNAAFTLLGLNRLFGKQLSRAKLLMLAKQLGSDVPFFFTSGSALASGRGERLKELKSSLNYRLVLVNPGFQVKTKWAYQNVIPKRVNQKFARRRPAVNLNELMKETESLGNDLAEAVIARHRVIGKIIVDLKQAGALYS
ncbi:MAG: 4-(cytidine 5'-diphospho)-2-C-methyl-D-erythritol kinase, partial [candidate division Zixibacteria bacterium]|nr:4-(cytidine 5'-diphospho)-2-C-methyl-D-erythritol kinase [candidate division Zixibacteria bacterium]